MSNYLKIQELFAGYIFSLPLTSFLKPSLCFPKIGLSIHELRILIYVKAIPLQALTSPEGSRRLRLPDFKKIGT
jgi:hypothetical protein